MSRISKTFETLARSRTGAYIPYVCAGDLGYGFTIDLVTRLCSSGADIVELGLPFSDPVADGPTIQGAMKRSLESGFKVAHIFKAIGELRKSGLQAPIVLMTYLNPVERMGVAEFCGKLAESGGDGLLVVDLPFEESLELDESARRAGIDIIRLVAPSTPQSRVKEIVSRTCGFVYAVSVSGVTGERKGLPESALPLIRRIKSETSLPIALGFGVSRPEHASSAIEAGASGVIEGSALISIYQSHALGKGSALDEVSAHASMMKQALSAICPSRPPTRSTADPSSDHRATVPVDGSSGSP